MKVFNHDYLLCNFQVCSSSAPTATEKSEVTVPYDKLYCFYKNIYWWNNDGDVVRLIDPEGNVVMEIEIRENSSPLLMGSY